MRQDWTVRNGEPFPLRRSDEILIPFRNCIEVKGVEMSKEE
jgi:hypothetical protein